MDTSALSVNSKEGGFNNSTLSSMDVDSLNITDGDDSETNVMDVVVFTGLPIKLINCIRY